MKKMVVGVNVERKGKYTEEIYWKTQIRQRTEQINILTTHQLVIIAKMEYTSPNLIKIVTMEGIQAVKIVQLFMAGSAFLYPSIVHIVESFLLLQLWNVGMENINPIMVRNVMILTWFLEMAAHPNAKFNSGINVQIKLLIKQANAVSQRFPLVEMEY